MEIKKTYLGDAVYAEIEHQQVKLTVNYGGEDTETIYLEPPVLGEFLRFLGFMP